MINDHELAELVEALLLERGAFLEPRTNTACLRERADRELLQLFRDEGNRIIACGALWDTRPELDGPVVYEVGTIWVRPSHRGNQLMEKMIQACVANAPANAEILLVSTSIPKVAEKMSRIPGWKESTLNAWDDRLDRPNEPEASERFIFEYKY